MTDGDANEKGKTLKKKRTKPPGGDVSHACVLWRRQRRARSTAHSRMLAE